MTKKYSGVGTLVLTTVLHNNKRQLCAMLAHERHKSAKYKRYIVDEFGGGMEPVGSLSQNVVKELIEESAGLIVPDDPEMFHNWPYVVEMRALDGKTWYKLHIINIDNISTSDFYYNMRQIQQQGGCSKIGWCETTRLHFVPVKDIINASTTHKFARFTDIAGNTVYVGPRFVNLMRNNLARQLRRSGLRNPSHILNRGQSNVTIQLNGEAYEIGAKLGKLGLQSRVLTKK